MIVSELKLYDFRKFHGNPGLSVTFHKGLNAIIGENDSGKTAIIDALKLVLLTQSNEYIRPTEYDFIRVQMVNQFPSLGLNVRFLSSRSMKQKTLLSI